MMTWREWMRGLSIPTVQICRPAFKAGALWAAYQADGDTEAGYQAWLQSEHTSRDTGWYRPTQRSVDDARRETAHRMDDRGRLRDSDGRLHPAHEPVTYLSDRQWVALGDTGVEVYHSGGCPCSRSQVWVRHRRAAAEDSVGRESLR